VRCRRCGLQFVSPRVVASAILDGYAAGADPEYVSQMAARVRTFARTLTHVERLAGGRGRLLDIGTAAGAFLKAATDAGWDATGIEPNGWLAEWGRRQYGVCIHVGSIDDVLLDGPFDVITLWDVIEHTPDPRAVLEHCARLLKPGGVLIVNYPDIGSWIARGLGRRWLFLTSVHLWYFDRRTIRRLLERTGFAVEVVRPHVQRLELDYILFRGATLSEALSKVSRATVRPLGLGRAQMPYWLGQTFVAARRAAPAQGASSTS
jgi:SAM-dependent methyltransferase